MDVRRAGPIRRSRPPEPPPPDLHVFRAGATPGREAGGVIHSTNLRINGIAYRLQYAEPNSPPCDLPEARVGPEEGGLGEFRILPAPT